MTRRQRPVKSSSSGPPAIPSPGVLAVSDASTRPSAKLLVDRHGVHATLEAARRADKLLAAGDMDGKRVWVPIMKAIVGQLGKHGMART